MRRKIDLENWERKDHFEFFGSFEEPFFGITVKVDCTKAYNVCKRNNYSFFLYYLHKSLTAANSVEEFRLRIEDNEVYIYDQIDASPTINRDKGPFGFSYIRYYHGFLKFAEKASDIIEKVRKSRGLSPAVSGENVIHYSSVPWIDFTSLSHARSYSFNDSCPKITFGKMTDINGIKSMPMAIHAHHALVDGEHAAKYIDEFQRLMNS